MIPIYEEDAPSYSFNLGIKSDGLLKIVKYVNNPKIYELYLESGGKKDAAL